MGELEERVARAIATAAEQNGGPPYDALVREKHAKECLFDEARAAIAVLRTPSDAPVSDADMRAFGASDAACYAYPGEDQGPLRAAFMAGAASGCQPPVSDAVRVATIERALLRQADNMAFVLNKAPLSQNWYEKFKKELAEDRAALSSSQKEG